MPTPMPPDPPEMPATCTLVCSDDHAGCAAFLYEQLPDRCRAICNAGNCCELTNNVWNTMIVHCVLPASDDAGVDAVPAAGADS